MHVEDSGYHFKYFISFGYKYNNFVQHSSHNELGNGRRNFEKVIVALSRLSQIIGRGVVNTENFN